MPTALRPCRAIEPEQSWNERARGGGTEIRFGRPGGGAVPRLPLLLSWSAMRANKVLTGGLTALLSCLIGVGCMPRVDEAGSAEALTRTEGRMAELEKQIAAERGRVERLEARLAEQTTEYDEALHRLIAETERLRAQAEAAVAVDPAGEAGLYPHRLRFRSGTEVACQVLALQDGRLHVELPGGEIKQAHLADVEFARMVRGNLPAPTAPIQSAPERPAEPIPAPAAAPGSDGLVLSPFWNLATSTSVRKKEELYRLLSPFGEPAEDRSVRPGAILFGDVPYLAPLDQAAATLGLGNPKPRQPLDTDGFPSKSLFVHEYESSVSNRYDRLLLVTDGADQTVAIQLMDSRPDSFLVRENPQQRPPTDWHLYNLVKNRTKGRSESAIFHHIERDSEDVLRIHSEYVSSQGETRECAVLFMPQPLVNLMLLLTAPGN